MLHDIIRWVALFYFVVVGAFLPYAVYCLWGIWRDARKDRESDQQRTERIYDEIEREEIDGSQVVARTRTYGDLRRLSEAELVAAIDYKMRTGQE